jgi:hypothetical protein
VEVLGDVPEVMFSWRVPNGPLPHRGRLDLVPVDGGTRVLVALRYGEARDAGTGPDEETVRRVLRSALRRMAARVGTQARVPRPSGA